MVRRRLTLKRIDPWSVLKFGAVLNLAMLAIGLLIAYVIWFVIERLNLIDQLCGIATDVGFTQCGVNAGNLFRALVLLGLLWVVVQTAVLVFLSFLHNLIADLTGGLAVSVIDDTPGAAARGEAPRSMVTASTPPPRAVGSRPPAGAVSQRRVEPAPDRRDEATREQPLEATREHRPVASGRVEDAGGEDLFHGR